MDATCLYMVASPEMFDVMVVENMFGDIVTDLGAITQGGLGVAAGGNINPEGVSMFEPIGGTAPMWTGKNAINPLAAIGAVQMMLEHLGETEAAALIEKGIAHAVSKMKSMAAGRDGHGHRRGGRSGRGVRGERLELDFGACLGRGRRIPGRRSSSVVGRRQVARGVCHR